MPRDAVAVTALASGAATTTPAGVAIAPANGANVAQSDASLTVVRVTNSAGAAKNVTVKAGAKPPAVRSGIGDLVVAVAAGADKMLCLESARFAQADGSINVDFEAGMTGTISAVSIPKAV